MEADSAAISEQTARSAFAAINAHDPDAMVACGHPSTTPTSSSPWAGRRGAGRPFDSSSSS